jgi:TPR repeat protein
MTAALKYYKQAAALGEEDAQAALKRLRCPFTLRDMCYDGPD